MKVALRMKTKKPTVELADLRAFVAVAKAGGFRKASRNAAGDESRLSRRIRQMEDILGASLFERSTAGVQLTGAGERFLAEALGMLEKLDAAIDGIGMEGRGEAGHINIGLVSSLSAGFLRELLTAWRAKFPDVELRFHKLSGNDAAARIVSRQIDVAFVAGEPKFYDGNTQPLWTSPLLAAIPQDHPAAENESIELKALASEEFLVTDMAPGPDIETFLITRLGDFGSKLRISRHAVGRETLLCMVGLGLGLTIVADTETGIAYPGVRFVPLEGEVMPFGALWLPGNDNPALRRFLSLARLMAKGWQAAQ